jgi:hypothetical protein
MKRSIFVILVVTLLGVFYVLTPNAAPTETPTAVMTQEQWTPVKGGEDLTQGKFWERVTRVNFVNGKLVIVAGDNYSTIINESGFFLRIHGDFGVSATIEVATDALGAISLFGELPQGAWWQGIKRLDVGIRSNQVSVSIYDGTGPNPAMYRNFRSSGISRKVQLEIRKVGGQLIVDSNGAEVGRLNDPGLFVSGKVYLGANVAPKNQLTIHNLSVETKSGGEANVQIIIPSEHNVEIPKVPKDVPRAPIMLGERCEAPVWNVGDKWTYKEAEGGTWGVEVKDVTEDLYIVKYSKGLYAYDKKTLNVKYSIEDGGRRIKFTEARRKLFDFPILIGKGWRDRSTTPIGGIEVDFLNEFKIEGVDEVRTPAGTFNAYRIFWKQTNMYDLGSGWVRFWYSPEVKIWIKREFEKSSFWAPIYKNTELISFKLK